MTVISDLAKRVQKTIEKVAGAAMLSLHIEGQPCPASRPRVSKFGTYYGKTYSRWMKDSWKSVDTLQSIPTDRPVIVMVEAVYQKPKTSKLDYPRADVDNLMKGPLDQITKLAKETSRGIWQDDNQILLAVTSKRFAEAGEEPGFYLKYTEIEI